MAIYESLILVCTLIGRNEHWMDIGMKREHFGAFSGFPAKGPKVNPRTKSQLVVNPDFGAPKSQKPSPESVAEENSGKLTENRKVNHGQLRRSKSRSKSRSTF